MILYLAKRKDDELLYDLLQSDLHPDIFDDLDLQTRLINSAAEISDWRTFRLLLVARLVVFERSARAVANSILQLGLEKRDEDGVLRILEDMKARKIPLNHEQTENIFQSLLVDYNNEERQLRAQSAQFYISVFRQLKSMDVPVPITHWRLVLLSLTRRGLIEDVERLCVELVDLFVSSPSSRPGFAPVHIDDVPEALRSPLGGVENLLGVYIPQDLPMRNRLHPLRRLFNDKLLGEMIEQSFLAHPGQGFHQGARPRRRQPQPFQISAMIRLMRILHERGMYLRYRKLVFAVKGHLMMLYGPATPYESRHRLMRTSNTLALQEMKNLIDEAWGGQLLPPIYGLLTIVRTGAPDGKFPVPPYEQQPADWGTREEPLSAQRAKQYELHTEDVGIA
jgi:hypothetical protein